MIELIKSNKVLMVIAMYLSAFALTSGGMLVLFGLVFFYESGIPDFFKMLFIPALFAFCLGSACVGDYLRNHEKNSGSPH